MDRFYAEVTDELIAFKAYMDKCGFAGCKVLSVPAAADITAGTIRVILKGSFGI